MAGIFGKDADKAPPPPHTAHRAPRTAHRRAAARRRGFSQLAPPLDGRRISGGLPLMRQVTGFYANVAGAWKDARDSLSYVTRSNRCAALCRSGASSGGCRYRYVLTDFWFKCSAARIGALTAQAGKPAFMRARRQSSRSLPMPQSPYAARAAR